MKVRQVELASIDTQGHVHKMTAWLSVKELKKVGKNDHISLKNQDPEVLWRIIRQFGVKEIDDVKFRQEWKVGGLSGRERESK